MTIILPQLTAPQDIEKIISILGPKVMGLQISEGKRIDSALFDEIKLNACVFIGLIESTDGKAKLTNSGRDYYKSTSLIEKKEILRERLRQIPVYDRTIEYLYHSSNFTPTKIDIAAYWHDNFSGEFGEMGEDELTNAAIFFIRFVEFADLGQYVQAGRGRDTHARLDQVKVAEYITSAEATPETIKKFQAEYRTSAEAAPETAKIIETETTKEDTTDVVPAMIDTLSQLSTTQSGALSGSNIRAIQKLQLELTEKELDSPGARKLILDMLDRAEKDNTVLKAKVDSYREIDKQAAVLETQVRSLSRLNLMKTTVNSIGGVMVGLSLAVSQDLLRWIVAGLGIALIIISIALRDSPQETKVI